MPTRREDGDTKPGQFHEILHETQREELELLAEAQGAVQRRIEEAFSGVELRLSRVRMRGTRRLAAELRARLQVDFDHASQQFLAGRPEDRRLHESLLVLARDLKDIEDRLAGSRESQEPPGRAPASAPR